MLWQRKPLIAPLGKIGADELTAEMVKNSTLVGGPYQTFGQPIGVVEKGKPTMHYDEDVSEMKKALLALDMVDIEDNLARPNLKIIGIKVFTGNDGMLYWSQSLPKAKRNPLTTTIPHLTPVCPWHGSLTTCPGLCK